MRTQECSHAWSVCICPDGHVHVNLIDEKGEIFATCPLEIDQIPVMCDKLEEGVRDVLRQRRKEDEHPKN